MDFRDIVGNDAPVLIAASAGAVCILAIDRDQPPARLLAGVPVSFAVSIYCTAALCQYFQIELPAWRNLIAFGLGMMGTSVASGFLKWARGLSTSTVIEFLLRRTKPTDQPDQPVSKEGKP